MLTASLGFSQVKVFSDGKTYIGDNTGVTSIVQPLVVNGSFNAKGGILRQSGASASLLFERTGFSAMAMGAGGNAGFTIDEDFDFEIRATTRSQVLTRAISAGRYIMKGDGADGHSAFGFAATSATSRSRFNGTIVVNGTILPSDKRLKEDVKEYNKGLDALMQINTISYKYNGKGGIDNMGRTHVGLFAQELQQIAPELVTSEDYYTVDEVTNEKTFEDTYLQINDTGIKYLIINAVQEQQEIIDGLNDKLEAQDDVISSLVVRLEALEKGSDDVSAINADVNSAYLLQNKPNPSQGQTAIDFNIPGDFNNAEILLTDETGRLIKKISIQEKGLGSLNLNATELSSGMYNYSLIVDGQIIDTKRMVLAK